MAKQRDKKMRGERKNKSNILTEYKFTEIFIKMYS